MLNAADHFEHLSDQALRAADQAFTRDQRIRHLEKAYEYAKMAAAERTRSNVYDFSSQGR